MLQVMHECAEGDRSSDASRADAKVRSTNHGTGRAGTTMAKTVVLMRMSVSSAAELRTAVKGLSKAAEVMQLSENTIDELNAEDGMPACQLHEGKVRAAGDSPRQRRRGAQATHGAPPVRCHAKAVEVGTTKDGVEK
eukprot:1853415-Pleurochrysis_carterae.AAC.1